MKLMINLAEETSSLSAAKAPKFKIQKVGAKRSLVVAKSASRDFKKALGLAAKAHKGVGVLQKQRANLASAQEKLSKATAMNKDHMRGLVKTAKTKIADTKKLIKQYNSEASKLLKSNFGLAITVPFSTEDLCSPTKAKSAKMKTFEGLKVKGMSGFVKTIVSVKDDVITGKTVKEVKNKDGSTRKSGFKSLDEIEDSMVSTPASRRRREDSKIRSNAEAKKRTKARIEDARKIAAKVEKQMPKILDDVGITFDQTKKSGKLMYNIQGERKTSVGKNNIVMTEMQMHLEDKKIPVTKLKNGFEIPGIIRFTRGENGVTFKRLDK